MNCCLTKKQEMLASRHNLVAALTDYGSFVGVQRSLGSISQLLEQAISTTSTTRAGRSCPGSLTGDVHHQATSCASRRSSGYGRRNGRMSCGSIRSGFSQVSSSSGSNITGIRSCIGSTTLSGVVVIIVQLLSSLPCGDRQISYRPAKPNISPSLRPIRYFVL